MIITGIPFEESIGTRAAVELQDGKKSVSTKTLGAQLREIISEVAS